ncbi:MAG TPA: protein-L-isoaspartate(D-aspartate) O-methyltransferase [Pseudomonadales bacterium]|nr:protein-L-isoaspartate(D-aspartate) O-methyltransferase [Pseudomonadales bacterium]
MVSEEDIEGIGMTSSRARMRLVKRLKERGIQNASVLDAIRYTPRHLFVDEALSHRAYEDVALPIGFSQTISQPYIVARMTEVLLEGGPLHKVLEIGTGSGYQTSVLARLVDKVYTVERIKPLLDRARQLLQKLKQSNVIFKHADGALGWAAHSPYDAIMVTAAPDTVPEALISQLKVGGRLVIPVGDDNEQFLHVFVRQNEGYLDQIIEQVRFVPLVQGNVGI